MKLKCLLGVTLFIFIGIALKAQDKTKTEESDTSKHVQIVASFPGGNEAWHRFLEDNLDAGVAIKNEAPAGVYEVKISFLVAKDGTVCELKIVKDPGYGTGEETLRVFNKSPKWNPATDNGNPVVFRQIQSLRFAVYDVIKKRKRRS